MVPFLDLFNHPSSATLPERLQSISVSGLAVQSMVFVDAPSAFATPASQELWLWYGYDAKDHGAFVEAYGFEPFD